MPQKKTVRRVCESQACRGVFYARPVDVNRGGGRFCGQSCASKCTAPPLPTGSGPENGNWKGGLTKSTKGYWYVMMPEHHRAMKSGYVKRADVVLEQKLGRRLRKGEIAHHKNEIKDDDSPDNLEPMFGKPHAHLHMQIRNIRHPPKPPPVRKPDAPSNRRYVWPSNAKLLRMRDTMTLRAIASVIGCDFKSVDRRVQRIRARLSR